MNKLKKMCKYGLKDLERNFKDVTQAYNISFQERINLAHMNLLLKILQIYASLTTKRKKVHIKKSEVRLKLNYQKNYKTYFHKRSSKLKFIGTCFIL